MRCGSKQCLQQITEHMLHIRERSTEKRLAYPGCGSYNVIVNLCSDMINGSSKPS